MIATFVPIEAELARRGIGAVLDRISSQEGDPP
jgi:hypothetical protein